MLSKIANTKSVSSQDYYSNEICSENISSATETR